MENSNKNASLQLLHFIGLIYLFFKQVGNNKNRESRCICINASFYLENKLLTIIFKRKFTWLFQENRPLLPLCQNAKNILLKYKIMQFNACCCIEATVITVLMLLLLKMTTKGGKLFIVPLLRFLFYLAAPFLFMIQAKGQREQKLFVFVLIFFFSLCFTLETSGSCNSLFFFFSKCLELQRRAVKTSSNLGLRGDNFSASKKQACFPTCFPWV